MKRKYKILYILSEMRLCDGICAYAMNYLRHINKEAFIFDFVVLNDDIDFEEELKSYGTQIYIMPNPLKNPYAFLAKVNDFFRHHKDYDIVHCHVANQAVFYLFLARMHGFKIRILHSHVTKSSDKLFNKIRNDILAPFAKFNANVYAACTLDAKKHLFGKKDAHIIHNAIDIDKFSFSTEKRMELRNAWKIGEEKVIGCVGRFVNQKNTLFTVEIFYCLTKLIPNVFLVLVGEGELEHLIRQKIDQYGISNKVLILPPSADISYYYSAMDCFLLPSIYEGLGIVYIEAQASGLLTFASDVVPKDTKVSDLIRYISLTESAEQWAKKIALSLDREISRKCPDRSISIAGYNIHEEVKKLEKLYVSLINSMEKL